jgi:branched-subunit amino acid transport protein
MNSNTRQLLAVTILTAIAAASNLVFVISKLPTVHWPSLASGLVAGAISVYAGILIRARRLRPTL